MYIDVPHGNVLVISDDRQAADDLGRWIKATGERPVLLVGAEKYLIQEGDDDMVDLVVTDLDSAHAQGRELLQRLLARDVFADVPQLHLFRDAHYRRSLMGQHPALETDSLAFPSEPDELKARVRLGAEIGRIRRELARSAIREPLTGLPNRRFFITRLDEEFARARRYRTPLSFVLFDIDQLKKINDRYGQESGDRVIRKVGEVLRRRVRKGDILARCGEESFAVLLPRNRYRGAAVFASNARAEIADELNSFDDATPTVRISAGVSSYPDNRAVRTPDHLIRAAEEALAEAKRRGGNRVFIDEAVMLGEKKLILVVDPDKRLLDLADDLLSMDDYRVIRSDSASTVVETLRFRRPDLLILDLQMRDGRRGTPLIERIHELSPSDRFPIIGLSRDPKTNPERLNRLGVDRFITKPFSLSVLRSVVRELLEAYSGEEAGAPVRPG